MNILAGIPYLDDCDFELEDLVKQGFFDKEPTIKQLNCHVLQSISALLEIDEDFIVVIKDEKGTWFTYLRDICFNYRDRACYLPYYTYEYTRLRKYFGFKGLKHVREDGDDILIRHNFKLGTLPFDLNTRLTLYTRNRSVTSDEQGLLVDFKFIEDATWSDGGYTLAELTKRYQSACCYESNESAGHQGGYHLIQQCAGVYNKEAELRYSMGLACYTEDNSFDALSYRDVRYYKKPDYELVSDGKNLDTLYWKRRLAFEMYLFCIIKDRSVPIDIGDRLQEFETMQNNSLRVFKIRGKMPFFIKGYWYNGLSKEEAKTWHKVK